MKRGYYVKKPKSKPKARPQGHKNKAAKTKPTQNKTAKTKPSKNKVDTGIQNEIIGVSIVALSLIIGLSLYSKQGGVFGQFLREFIIGLIGISGYSLPVITLIVGIAILRRKIDTIHKYKTLILSLLANISILAHVAYYGKALKSEFSFVVFSLSYYKEAKWNTGGFIGSVLGNALLTLVGLYGSYIVLITTLVILSIMLTGISYVDLIENIVGRSNDQVTIMRTRLKNKKTERKRKKEIEKSIRIETEPRKESVTKIEADPEPQIQPQLEDKANQPQEAIKAGHDKAAGAQTPHKKVEIPSFETNYYDEYKFPTIDLLGKGAIVRHTEKSKQLITSNGHKLEQTLRSFGVEAKILNIHKGPTVTRYELQPKTGVKVSKIVNLADDIALNLAATGIRIEAPIPGKSAVGIEVPNADSAMVNLREVIDQKSFEQFPSKLAFALGKDIGGKSIITDIGKMPHLLIAGATGSGKSVCINTLIISILYKAHPSEVKLIMIDPKVVELNVYNGIPHLLIPVVTDPKKASSALHWAVQEMNQRYQFFADSNVRDIGGYNAKIDAGQLIDEDGVVPDKMPHIVIIIDELADLMMSSAREVEDAIARLAQMARAAGIHLVIATQRPSVDVITGVIKANIPSRLAFAVSSGIDSRTILDTNGAEKLLGKGDMLFYPVGAAKPVRIQGAFVSDEEVENIVQAIKSVQTADYKEDVLEAIESQVGDKSNGEDADELLDIAIDSILDKETASISFLQRSLRVGFNRASRIMDSLESLGIVSADEGSKPRRVLVTREQYEREDTK